MGGCYHWQDDLLTLHCLVVPGSTINRIVGVYDSRLKIKISTPASAGKANQHLIHYLSEQLAVPISAITIKKGERAHRKTIEIKGLSTIPPVISAICHKN